MVSYPYDWKGTSPANAFTEERVITGDNPTDRVVILKSRPFFETSLVVTATGSTTPLTRGVDYEIAYQMPELDDSVASPVANGVILINPDVGGGLTFKGQALGESFYSPFIDILDELVKHLNNPVDVDWFKVENRPTFFPAKPAATSWADLLNKKYVASAVHDVVLDSTAANDAVRAKLDQLKVTVTALGAEIAAFNYPAHVKATNPHGTTPAQANAHPASLKTPDTFLAYGKTLRQLTADIRALGLQQSDIDKYIEKWASKDVSGVFIQQLAANRSLFKSKSGVSEITFTDTAFTLKSNGAVILAAGYDPKDTTVRFMEWVSGTNTLRIESSGNALGMDKLTLNGKVLLTTTLLMKYQPSDAGSGNTDPDDQKIYVQGQNGLKFTGKGSKADPIKGTLTVPTATTAVKGVAKLKTGPGTETSGVAATPASLTPYEGKANNYVPKTTMLNSKPMDGDSRALTKADMGLGSADNTRDVAKPISGEQQAAMDKLSDKGHKHDFAELGLPDATAAIYGLGRYTNLEDGLAATKGVTPNLLKSLSDRLDVIWSAIASVRTGMTADFSAIDASTWSVSGKSTLQVKDLQYFYLRDGVRGEGKVSGSINLDTTPMFNWFSPDNTLEKTWASSVKNTAATFNFDSISKKPALPLKGVPIGLSANAMGDLSVVSLVTKLRLKSVTGIVRVYVAGGGKVTVYMDGEAVGSGNAPFYIETEAASGKETFCLGIRVDCNSASVAAAMAFEVYDENAPLFRSDAGIPMAQLSEFITPAAGNRHYLYLNMLTTSLYSRAEPVITDKIDAEHALIGYLDYPTGGITSSTVSFSKMIDYGESKELATHIAREDVHVPDLKDWHFSDNPSMLPIGKLRMESKTALYNSPAGTYSNYFNSLMLGRNASNETCYAFLETKDQTPQFWFTPSNPKADGHPTIEGGLVYDAWCQGKPFARPEPELIFATKQLAKDSADYRNRYLRIKLDGTGLAEFGYVSSIVAHTGHDTNIPVFTGITSYNAQTVSRQESIAASPSVLDLPSAVNQQPRMAVRYRYDIKLRQLRVFKLYYPGSIDGTVTPFQVMETLYEFDVDMTNYMGGWIGFAIPGGSPNYDYYNVLGTVMELENVGFDDSKYHYYRSLFESYVDVSLSASTNGTIRTTTMNVTDIGFYTPSTSDTEWVGMPSGGGVGYRSHDGKLPMMFNRQQINQGSVLRAKGSGVRWFSPAGATANLVRHRQPIAARYQPADAIVPSKLVLKVTSSYRAKLFFGEQVKGTIEPNATTQINYTTNIEPGRGAVPIYIGFEPVDAVPPVFTLAFTLDVYGQDGKIAVTVTEADDLDVVGVGQRYVIKRLNPLHMTERVWTWLQAQMDKERATDGTDFGQWV